MTEEPNNGSDQILPFAYSVLTMLIYVYDHNTMQLNHIIRYKFE